MLLILFGNRRHTDLVKHLVALIKNERLDVSQVQVLIADQCIETAWRADNDVGCRVLVLEGLDVGSHGCAPEEDLSLDIWQVLAESGIFVLDLVGQFSSVTHYQDGTFSRNRLELVKCGEDEDSSLTKTRLGLT